MKRRKERSGGSSFSSIFQKYQDKTTTKTTIPAVCEECLTFTGSIIAAEALRAFSLDGQHLLRWKTRDISTNNGQGDRLLIQSVHRKTKCCAISPRVNECFGSRDGGGCLTNNPWYPTRGGVRDNKIVNTSVKEK